MLTASGVSAQMPGVPNPDTVRVRLGPLWLNPTLSLANAGVDNNVFNEADNSAPKSDFTLTITPATDLWLRLGRTWIAGNVREDLVWYKEYSSERSANNYYSLGWIVPLNRLSFTVGGHWVSTRERPGFEIDARSDRSERAATFALELKALAKTRFGVRGERRNIDFASDAVFLGRSLQETLNRTDTDLAFTIGHELTPLTTLTLDVGRQQDRFDFIPDRDSNSTRITAGVSFDPFALLKGSARFGFRAFTPLAPDVPEYRGSTAAVDLSYIALGTTRFNLRATRDVDYSFEVDQPYYVQTGVSGSVTQQIYGPLDVEGRLGRQGLAYRNRTTALDLLERVDRIRSYGFGAGYRLGADLRIGFNVDQHKRSSGRSGRTYDGLRYGVAVTYGVR